MNTKFDELTKQMAQSVTRRAALKKFGVGLAGMALACFGLASNARAGKGLPPPPGSCQRNQDCALFGPSHVCCKPPDWGIKICVADKSQCS